LAKLPDSLPSIATALDGLADFFQRVAPHYKPEGPVPVMDRPNYHDALKTTAIHQIAKICEKHFGTALLGAVATLANASLNRNDIDGGTVRGSLKPKKKVLKSKQENAD